MKIENFNVLIISLFLFQFICIESNSQENNDSLIRTVAILNLQDRNDDSSVTQQQSLIHISQVAGFPFIVTKKIDEAIKYKIIISTDKIYNSTINVNESNQLTDYVKNGGVWVVPEMRSSKFNNLFGITNYEGSNKNHSVIWDLSTNDKSLRWIDDSLEMTISLGDTTKPEVLTTYGYEVSNATILARFSNERAAVTKNKYGNGFAYNIGFSFKDLIILNQLMMGFEPQRFKSNGFEPTSDVVILFIRAIYQTHVPAAVWKHSSPYFSRSVLMITHDVDAESAMLMMNLFADSEKKRGISATFNITTKNFFDSRGTNYFSERNFPLMKQILNEGHVIGNHSFGHFSDFDDTLRFPLGKRGNTVENYTPKYEGTETIGGNVYGEVEVSDFLLRKELGITPRIWRSGHLLVPKYLFNVLEDFNYPYSSTNNAANVLTNFPYHCKANNKSSGKILNLIEIPMAISDVFHADPISEENIMNKVELWHSILEKNSKNYAPTVLLIHPNREFKLIGQEALLNMLPEGVVVQEITTFGDFWMNREQLDFDTEFRDAALKIILNNASIKPNEQLSLIVENSSSIKDISVWNKAGDLIPSVINKWDNNQSIISFFDQKNKLDLKITEKPDFCEDSIVVVKLHLSGRFPIIIEYEIDEKYQKIISTDSLLELKLNNPQSFEVKSIRDFTCLVNNQMPPKIYFIKHLKAKSLFDFTNSGEEIVFQNKSENAQSLLWNFGDGTSSKEENPIHKFDNLGLYKISLTVHNNYCSSDTFFREILIKKSVIENVNNVSTDQINIYKSVNELIVDLKFKETGKSSITIFDLSGRYVFDFDFVKEQYKCQKILNIKYLLNSGIYLVEVKINNSKFIKMIKI